MILTTSICSNMLIRNCTFNEA
uniref:Uncharacterized protein n=1 Tax=Heterorhabditis bacteriophora TaxID=37862 RepID=A0A1I7WGQ1_HETBA